MGQYILLLLAFTAIWLWSFSIELIKSGVEHMVKIFFKQLNVFSSYLKRVSAHVIVWDKFTYLNFQIVSLPYFNINYFCFEIEYGLCQSNQQNC